MASAQVPSIACGACISPLVSILYRAVSGGRSKHPVGSLQVFGQQSPVELLLMDLDLPLNGNQRL